jgi:DNA-binding CsgD family transcriptional regulator
MTDRSREAAEFISTVDDVPPQAVSACEGWTTHEIAAHVTGIAVEVIRHLEPFLQGDPVPKTRSFEEREAPLQAMEHAELLRRLDTEETRMRRCVDDVLDRDPDAVIPWTGRHMAVAKFIPHLRNEHALHRWDLAGDDDTSRELLGALDLVDHSVGELGAILLVAGRKHDPDPDAEFGVRLRTVSRETEVAHLVGKGLSNPDIGSELFISRKAVEYHLSNIYAKCGLHGRQQLRRFAEQWRQPATI